ncbi:hypothetical protein EPYR_02500 [Erwinia pyrifoliae DSM 12163]|nr:hypothetical protein EPYR_02500 [Erwinia pyrifoliae DSM 12163]
MAVTRRRVNKRAVKVSAAKGVGMAMNGIGVPAV